MGNHSNIPFSRVNHSKFMVTDKTAYIGEWLEQDAQKDRELDKSVAGGIRKEASGCLPAQPPCSLTRTWHGLATSVVQVVGVGRPGDISVVAAFTRQL